MTAIAFVWCVSFIGGIMHVTKRGHQWRLGRSMTVKFQGVEARWEIWIMSETDISTACDKESVNSAE